MKGGAAVVVEVARAVQLTRAVDGVDVVDADAVLFERSLDTERRDRVAVVGEVEEIEPEGGLPAGLFITSSAFSW